MLIGRYLVKAILGSSAVICFVLVCIFSFVLPITAQPIISPDPKAVKERIKQRLASELYIAWNYSINGIKPHGVYDGPYEGGLPDPKVVEKNLKEYLPQHNKQISEEPLRALLYGYRGATYTGLYEVTEDLNEQALFAERALADFNKAIKLEPNRWSTFELRATLLKRIDFFAYFGAIVSDYLEAIRLIQNFCLQNPRFCTERPDLAKEYESDIAGLFSLIGNLYWKRAKALTESPKLFAEVRRLHKQYSDYSYLDDFDAAIKYVQKGGTLAYEVAVTTFFVDKGDAAYRLGDYKTALNAYNVGKEYWDKKCAFDGEPSPTYCDNNKKYLNESFKVKLTKVYVKLEKWETALIYLNQYLNLGSGCPEPYLVRARIYRQLGQTDLAFADEQTAGKLPSPRISCYSSAEQWK